MKCSIYRQSVLPKYDTRMGQRMSVQGTYYSYQVSHCTEKYLCFVFNNGIKFWTLLQSSENTAKSECFPIGHLLWFINKFTVVSHRGRAKKFLESRVGNKSGSFHSVPIYLLEVFWSLICVMLSSTGSVIFLLKEERLSLGVIMFPLNWELILPFWTPLAIWTIGEKKKELLCWKARVINPASNSIAKEK